MEIKKSKIFTHKLIALFLSVLMALSCFTGALTAFAASNTTDKNYHDGNLASNFMAWAETTDEQTAEALLDYADLYLGDLMTGLLGTDHIYFSQNIVVATITVDGYLDSIDGIYDLIRQADGILNSYGGIVGGDVKNLDLSPIADLTAATSGDYVVSQCGKSYRQNYSAKELIMALAKTLYINSNDFAGKNVVGQFIKGSLDLGILENFIGGNVYELLQGAFGMWDGYQWNLVYNLVANIILNNTKWFTDEEKAAYLADLQKSKASDRTYAWNFDDVLFKALNQELIQKISVLVTYPNRVLEEVDKKDANGNVIRDEDGNAVKVMEYVNDSSAYRKAENRIQDPKLVYSSEEQYANNVLLFVYDENGDGTISDSEKLSIQKDDTLFSFAFRALEFAWKTVLRDTLGLVHVNYNGHESVEGSVGSNYDNQFFYWMTGEGNRGWDYTDWTSNYTAANVEAWAEAVCADYGLDSAEAFITAVKRTYEYDRNVVADAKGNWQDIDSTSLFNKLRYSPLADIYFDMQTGPINLYFEQTGVAPMTEFFNTAFDTYDNMVAGFNDALVAATKLFFIDSDNIGYGSNENDKPVTNLTVPTMATTGNTTDSATVAATLVANFMDMFEYAADTADANILNSYYVNNNITVSTTNDNLSETNLEEAVVPLLVACLNTPALDDLTGMIHDEKWDSAKDAEGVAVVVLEEYLSYVLPDKDYSVLWTYDADGYLTAKSGTLYDTAVLPMARDALGYVISSVVPCRTASGAEWNVYETPVTDTTTIFEILNSVMCYYASADNFSDGTTGKAVASLLGVVDASGNCLVSMNNDIWTNLDNIVNSLLPVIGTLQYGTSTKAGQASSKELIYDNLISSILEVGAVNSHSKKQGLTTIIQQIFTIVTADPISNQGIDVMVYDELLVPIVNNLFGARYTGQGYDKVIPYSSWYDVDAYSDTNSSSPFDSLVTTSTLGYYSAASDTTDNNNTGVIGILICNIYEAFGGANYSNAGTRGCWTGAMFAVEAVNNFIPSFVPQLSDHELNAATAEIAMPSQSGLTSSSPFTPTTLNITNNSIGLNRFYRDENGNVQRDPRYFMNVTSVKVSSSDGNVSNLSLGDATGVIAPEKTKKVSISGSAPTAGVLYTFTVKYNIFKGEMNGTTLPTPTAANTVYENLETIAYMYLTTDKDWKNTLYSRDYSSDVKMFDSNYETGDYGQTTTMTVSTPRGGTAGTISYRAGYLWSTLPSSFIVPMSDPDSIEKLGFRVRNDHGTGNGHAFDGIYTYLSSGTEYYPVSNGVVQSTTTVASADDNYVAYAAIDKTTGDVLNYDLYDYYNPNTGEWVRGDVMSTGVHGGFTEAEIKALDSSITEAEGFNTRAHVAYTIDEVLATGYVKGVQRTAAAVDSTGKTTYAYDAVLIDLTAAKAVTPSGEGDSAATLLLQGTYADSGKKSISWGTPTPGIYLASGKTNIPKSSSVYTKFLNYDGSTALSADDYDMNVQVYTTNNNNMSATIHMYIADDTGASTLTQAYNNNLNTISTYRAADFTDYDEATGTSETYEAMKVALSDAVKTISTPVTTENATKLGSQMISEAKTETVTTELHKDIAYTPIPTTTALPAAIQAYATKGADGYWYYNEECTIPVYSNTELSGTNLTQDATGTPVALGEDGKYHIVNTPVYETEWDTTTPEYKAPYLAPTTTQATDSEGKLLYKEISFVYRDAQGNKVNSDDNWAYKLAEKTTVIKPNDGTEYRGMYQLEIDNLAYSLEQLQAKVDTAIANRIVNEVSEDRKNLNNVNYNVASYEKMVQIARDAESLIWYEATDAVDENGDTIYEAVTNKSSLQIDAAVEMYNEFKGYVQSRGYIGDKLEAEISCATTPGYDSAANADVADTVYTYNDFDYTQTIETDANDNDIVTAATITSATATAAAYGAWVDGSLVNQGEIVYTDASWNEYIIALSNAIKVADAKTAKLSEIYSYKIALQRAENNLTEVGEEPAGDTITVSGTVMIATNDTGSAYTVGITGIDIYVGATIDTANGNAIVGGELVGTTAADGTFTVEVPAGTTELIINGESTVPRTVTLSGTANVTDAIIPIVICDYNHDGKINGTDSTAFMSGYAANDVYCDLSGDGNWNGTDMTAYGYFIGKTVDYAPLPLD